ncbi:MAG TPA: ComF family protein [Clostridiales bacterium]|nr:ComF family protein [Clostridiales bacterium]
MKKQAAYFISCILDFLFPQSCLVCAKYLNDEIYICRKCLNNLEIHKNESKNYMSVFSYNDTIKTLIHELKYNGRPELGYIFGKEMGKRLKEYFESGKTVLIPVPLHIKRLKKRGYNQSELICSGLSEVTGLEVRKDILVRKLNNMSQTRLNAAGRSENVKGIFDYSGAQLDKDTLIILVDDLITTGATSKEASQTLKKYGFINFFAVSVATSSNQSIMQ